MKRSILTFVVVSLLSSLTVVVHAEPKRTANTSSNDEELPIYVSTRGSIAIPSDGLGEVVSLGGGFGVVMDSDKPNAAQHHLGLRLIWIPNPPKNPLGDEVIGEVGNAWGPVLDWKVLFSPKRRISLFTSASLGFVYGVPKLDDEMVSRTAPSGYTEEKTRSNVVLPILEGGVGVQVTTKEIGDSKMRLFISPELGFVPGVVAPYAAITIGLL